MVTVPGNQPKGRERAPCDESRRHPTTDTTELHTSPPSSYRNLEPIPINHDTDMDVEPNSGITNSILFHKSNAESFNA